MNTMPLVTETLYSRVFIHHNTLGVMQVQCQHVQYIIFLLFVQELENFTKLHLGCGEHEGFEQ